MAAIEWFRDMATNNAWANERLYAACAQLTEEELVLLRTNFFPTIKQTLAHIAIVDLFYVDGLEEAGQGARIWEREAALEANFQATRDAQRDVDGRLRAFVARSSDRDLERKIGLERRTGVQMDRIGDILLHLFQHQVHHRGQVHAMLSGTRIAPPELDAFFLAGDRPSAMAELERVRGR